MESTSLNIDNSKRNTFRKKAINFLTPTKRTIVELIAMTFVIIFLYTGISKLMEFAVFKEQIGESPVLKSVAPVIIWALPITEFIVSILLFFPKFRRRGLQASLVLMILFTGYVIAILSFSDKLPCSCGGIMAQLSWPAHIVFNCIMISLSIIALRLLKKSRVTD